MDRKLHIGITERGDAGLDLSWTHRLSAMDGAILITKNLNDRFRQALSDAAQTKPVILRAFYVNELTIDAPAEALPDKNVDIVLTHEEAQRIADQLFPWL